MIAKHIPIKSLKKSDFANLVNYLTDDQGKLERVGDISITNCYSGTVDAAITEVLAKQQLNTRTESDKTYHLVVSFRQGENPSKEVLSDIEKVICEDLGFGEHQRVSVVHHDTDNVHMHLAINKIHPENLTTHDPFQSYRKLSRSCAKLELKHGLEVDNHISNRISSASRANDMEAHSGIESLVGWIKRNCVDDISAASTWNELHEVMESNGLELKKRGNGFSIVSDSGIGIKASTLGREFSKQKLEKKLGQFEGHEYQSGQEQEYGKEPIKLKVDTSELYKQYKKQKQESKKLKAHGMKFLRQKKYDEIEAIKKTYRLKRLVIKLSKNYLMRKVLYKQASKLLVSNIKKINSQYQKDSKILTENYQNLTWADWLKSQAQHGNKKALETLRARKQKEISQNNSLSGGVSSSVVFDDKLDSITKKGTVVYGKDIRGLRYDGKSLKISKNITPESIISALNAAKHKFGKRINVTGSDNFKQLIVKAAAVGSVDVEFIDKNLEKKRIKLLKEKSNEHRRRSGSNSSGHVDDGRGTTRDDRGRSRDGVRRGTGSLQSNFSHVRGGRFDAPPQRRHRMQNLSELGLASIIEQTPVLLQSDVSSNVDKRKAGSADHTLRWGIFGERLTPEQKNAAKKYIEERNLKRHKINSIPEHSACSEPGKYIFKGKRVIDGELVILLSRSNSKNLFVLPVASDNNYKLEQQLTVSDKMSVSRARKSKSR